MHYETAEAAESAIKAVNGMLLNDKKVYVGHHISRKVCISPPISVLVDSLIIAGAPI